MARAREEPREPVPPVMIIVLGVAIVARLVARNE
jgi:hypothetical protein